MFATPAPASPHARPILAICVAMGFTTLLDQAIFALAIPTLRESLHASAAQLQLIVAIYSIAFGVALVPAGRLGDIIGRRLLFLVGLAMFSGFSLLGGLAGSATVVIAARLLQGLGAGIINTQVLGLIQDTFTGTGQARALGRYAAAGGLAGLAGPVLGGLILALAPADAGWRLMFLVNVPFGLLIFHLARRYLPHGRPRQVGRLSIDLPGLVLLGIATLALMAATLVNEASTLGTHAWLALAALAATVFVLWEIRYARRGGTPLLARGLVRSPGYLLGTGVAMCQFAAGLTLGMIGTLFFLDGMRISPLLFAALSITPAIGMSVSSSYAWRFSARYGRAGVVAAIAANLCVAALLGTAISRLPAAGILLVYPVIGLLQGAASGLIHAPNQAMTLVEAAPSEGRGLAAGFFQLSQRLACSIGMSWGTGVFLVRAAHGGLTAYRHAFADALLLVFGLMGGALAAAAADWIRRRRKQAAT